MTKHKYIHRINANGSTGWFLSIVRKGLVYREFFSMKKYGVRKALRYAEQTRDLVLTLAGMK